MKIAIVTIGDELLNGDVIDTNTAAIASTLRSEGYAVDQAITLGDNPQQIAATLQHLNQQKIVALVCGGLGPTRDDVTARSDDEQALDQTEDIVRQRLGVHVVAQGDETLPGVVAHDLIRSEKTLSLAESCTGGLIAKLLTDIAGSSAFLERCAVTYANSAKHDMLGITNELLLNKGAVSNECARAMVNGIRKRAKTDLALAVTGIAGPGGGSVDKPCGTVFIALATPQGTEVRECHFSGDRHQVRTKTAYTALDWLRRTLKQ